MSLKWIFKVYKIIFKNFFNYILNIKSVQVNQIKFTLNLTSFLLTCVTMQHSNKSSLKYFSKKNCRDIFRFRCVINVI